MNHHINLLEEHERKPVQQLDAVRLVKPIAGLLVVLVAAGAFFFFRANSEVVREADALSREWRDMEKRVKEAEERSEKHERLQRAWETLLAWPASRYPWGDVLNHTRDAIPEPREQFQFLLLSFDEDIRGVRTGARDGEDLPHPPVRMADIRLTGRIQAERPDRLRFDLEDRLRGNATRPSPFVTVKLENPPVLPDPPAGSLPVSGFHFTLSLPPSEIVTP